MRGKRRIGDEASKLVRVGEQVDETEADRVAGRLVARRREEDEEGAELLLREARALELRLDEPGRHVVARLTPARLAERAAVLDQVERERAREREHPQLRIAQRALDDELLADDVRVRVAEDLVAQLDDQLPVVDRQPHDLGEDPHRDLGGHASTQSNASCSNAASRIPRASSRIRSSYALMTRGVKPLLTIARIRVCGGGSVSSIDFRASSSSGVRSCKRRPAELVGERLPVLRDRDDVVVARDRPVAAALDLGLPEDRCVAAEEREPVVRHAALPGVEVVEVDVVEREPVERRAGNGCGSGVRTETWSSRAWAAASAAGGGESRTRSVPSSAARLVDRQRLERGRGEHVARPHVELRAVTGADHDRAVELASGERALLVRARVVERDPLVFEPRDADRSPAGLDLPERSVRQVVGGADVVPVDRLRHEAGP